MVLNLLVLKIHMTELELKCRALTMKNEHFYYKIIF